jgi:DNA-binding SARP family transcriptional activator
VRCLGPLEAEWEGAERPLAWPSRRGKTLFKYLVLQRDRRASREALMALLWPDADPAAARRNLNVTVHGLRRSMSGSSERSCVRFRDGAYVLDPELDAWVDVDEFGRLAASARRSARAGDTNGFVSAARAAEALYRGDLFEDDLYDEWLEGRRRELRDDHLDLLEALGECHLGRSDHTACAEACHAVLADEPERETAHRRLMRSYARQGRRHLALRQYERCITALRRALDVPPDAETLSLVARIRRGDPV